MSSNALQQFFNSGFKLTPDAKLNLIITAAAIGGVAYYAIKKSEIIHLSFAGNLMAFNNASPESAIDSITAWIIKRSSDKRTTGENIQLIRANVLSRRAQILAVINERFAKTISLGEYKRKLKLIGIEVAQSMNIALRPKLDPTPNHLDPRGKAKGYFDMPKLLKKDNPGNKVKAMAAVSNYYHTAYEA